MLMVGFAAEANVSIYAGKRSLLIWRTIAILYSFPGVFRSQYRLEFSGIKGCQHGSSADTTSFPHLPYGPPVASTDTAADENRTWVEKPSFIVDVIVEVSLKMRVAEVSFRMAGKSRKPSATCLNAGQSFEVVRSVPRAETRVAVQPSLSKSLSVRSGRGPSALIVMVCWRVWSASPATSSVTWGILTWDGSWLTPAPPTRAARPKPTTTFSMAFNACSPTQLAGDARTMNAVCGVAEANEINVFHGSSPDSSTRSKSRPCRVASGGRNVVFPARR